MTSNSYSPIFSPVRSSTLFVYPDGPVQLYVYGNVPPVMVTSMDPFASPAHKMSEYVYAATS